MSYSSNLRLPRFMMHFSYAGQAYAGVQINLNAKISSVQGVIERALYHFQSSNFPLRFGVSSRTDRGVHALHNTGTFDWIAPIDVTTLVEPLNRYLEEHNEQIRIQRIHPISPHFHFRRHCQGRKYIYRLGFLKEHEFTNVNSEIPFLNKKHRYLLRDLTPASYNLFDREYITYVEPPYDLDLFRQGLEVFQGQHNFSAFTTTQGRVSIAVQRLCPVKTMRLQFHEGEELIPLMNSSPLHSSMRIYNIVFEAESFLYKLIRRITATLVHIAKGQMTIQDVRNRFDCPPDYYDSALPVTMTPNGLFLYQVKYNEEHFLNPPIISTHDSIEDEGDDIIVEEDDEEDHQQTDSRRVSTG